MKIQGQKRLKRTTFINELKRKIMKFKKRIKNGLQIRQN